MQDHVAWVMHRGYTSYLHPNLCMVPVVLVPFICIFPLMDFLTLHFLFNTHQDLYYYVQWSPVRSDEVCSSGVADADEGASSTCGLAH